MSTSPPPAAGNHDAGAVPLHERPEFIAWLTASCQRQGLPVTITDPTVIARIATLLGAHQRARPASPTRRTRATCPTSRLRDPGARDCRSKGVNGLIGPGVSGPERSPDDRNCRGCGAIAEF